MTAAKANYEGVAKLFMNGRSQAVRLPSACRFDGVEVYIKKVGDDVILSPRPKNWDTFFASTQRTSSDFMRNREDTPPQVRVELK